MIRSSALVGALLLMTVFVAGCPVIHSGKTQVKWDKGGTSPRIIDALHEGNYLLYAFGDAKPKFTQYLKRGDALGFEKSSGGHITAVAGERRFELENDDTYYWNFTGKD